MEVVQYEEQRDYDDDAAHHLGEPGPSPHQRREPGLPAGQHEGGRHRYGYRERDRHQGDEDAVARRREERDPLRVVIDEKELMEVRQGGVLGEQVGEPGVNLGLSFQRARKQVSQGIEGETDKEEGSDQDDDPVAK